MIVNTWRNCYPSNWKGKIVPEAFQHPAKYSSKLIRAIYEHIVAEGWVKPGDVIVDPFGGIALGALDAMRLGLAWRGIELEAHFAQIGNQNIDLWNKRFSTMPRWSGDAVLFGGDSRKLAEILAGAQAAVSSPPYAETRNAPGGDQVDDLYRDYHGDGGYGAAVSSPPFADMLSRDRVDPAERVRLAREMGIPNAANLSVIEMEKIGKRNQSYSATVSSPPYADSVNQSEAANDTEARIERMRRAGIDVDNPVNVGGPNGVARKPQSYAVAVSSPPYADGCAHTGGNDSDPSHIQGGTFFGVGIAGVVYSPPYGDVPLAPFMQGEDAGKLRVNRGQAYAVVSSPPYASASEGTPLDPEKYPTLRGVLKDNADRLQKYGESTGQLGAMKATESGFQAAISSPPFAGSTADGGWQMLGKYAAEGKLTVKQVKGKADKAYPSWSKDRNTDYAPSEANLGNATATEAGFQAAVSSPPFQGTTGGSSVTAKEGILSDERLFKRHAGSTSAIGYGEADGNLGNELGNDFWLSARAIVEQVYQVIQPGGHAVWVVKDYVKNKQRVPFCDQWRELCEAVGFVALHEHHAMLVRDNGTSLTLDGGEVKHQTESKSFFRRLAEKKGSPPINWETVLCMEKPAWTPQEGPE